jgi:hypothetical protein
MAISGLPFGSPETKSHLDVAPVESRIVKYKGEGGGFPQIHVVVSLVCPSCPWLVLTPKVLQLCINHLVLVLCKSMWIIEACQFFLVPSRNSNTPLYPFKVLRAKECASTFSFFAIFSLGLAFESFKELGARQNLVDLEVVVWATTLSWSQATRGCKWMLQTHLGNGPICRLPWHLDNSEPCDMDLLWKKMAEWSQMVATLLSPIAMVSWRPW